MASVSFGLVSMVFAQSQSILTLEPRVAKPPFSKGEQLDIRGDATIFTGVTRITVLDPSHWPWVRVKWGQAEMWLNFDHVVIASSVATPK